MARAAITCEQSERNFSSSGRHSPVTGKPVNPAGSERTGKGTPDKEQKVPGIKKTRPDDGTE